MMKLWTEFLATQQHQPLQQHNTLCALNDTALLYVGGDDATDFLQNQLSNDITHIDEHKAQLSSLSNAKGRMLGIFRVVKIDGGYLLVMPKSIIESIQNLLQKFIVMSKVMLADITDSFALLSVITDQQALVSGESFPSDIHQVYQSDSLICLRLQSTDNQHRFLMLSNNAQEAIKIWSEFSSNLQINDSDNWRLQEIVAGIPALFPDTVAAFVLQMSNLHFIDGVSFKKGCYPGQEVVARMQYLGKLKRRMFLAEINSTDCPKPGDELRSIDSDKADNSGKVVDAIQLKSGVCVMLFIAQIEKTEHNGLVLVDQPEVDIKLKTLPYNIEI